jgi:molybdopterin-guanine dinucleotide biosynthesis protein A
MNLYNVLQHTQKRDIPMDRSAIILAGGHSKGFGQDKGLIELNNKPLINHVIDAVKNLVEEVIVVTDSTERAQAYQKIVSPKVKFTVDSLKSQGPLIGALTGFEAAQGNYSLLLPYDAPFVSKEVISLLLDCCVGKTAVIPRWSSEEIDPLQSAYQTKLVLESAKKAVEEGEVELPPMVDRLRGVRYISSMVFEQLDPDMRSFFRVNTPIDLKKAVVMLTPRQAKTKNKRKK